MAAPIGNIVSLSHRANSCERDAYCASRQGRASAFSPYWLSSALPATCSLASTSPMPALSKRSAKYSNYPVTCPSSPFTSSLFPVKH